MLFATLCINLITWRNFSKWMHKLVYEEITVIIPVWTGSLVADQTILMWHSWRYAVHSLLFDHLSLGVLKTFSGSCILIQSFEQLQRVQDALVGVLLIERLLSLVDLCHILREKHRIYFILFYVQAQFTLFMPIRWIWSKPAVESSFIDTRVKK